MRPITSPVRRSPSAGSGRAAAAAGAASAAASGAPVWPSAIWRNACGDRGRGFGGGRSGVVRNRRRGRAGFLRSAVRFPAPEQPREPGEGIETAASGVAGPGRGRRPGEFCAARLVEGFAEYRLPVPPRHPAPPDRPPRRCRSSRSLRQRALPGLAHMGPRAARQRHRRNQHEGRNRGPAARVFLAFRHFTVLPGWIGRRGRRTGAFPRCGRPRGTPASPFVPARSWITG